MTNRITILENATVGLTELTAEQVHGEGRYQLTKELDTDTGETLVHITDISNPDIVDIYRGGDQPYILDMQRRPLPDGRGVVDYRCYGGELFLTFHPDEEEPARPSIIIRLPELNHDDAQVQEEIVRYGAPIRRLHTTLGGKAITIEQFTNDLGTKQRIISPNITITVTRTGAQITDVMLERRSLRPLADMSEVYRAYARAFGVYEETVIRLLQDDVVEIFKGQTGYSIEDIIPQEILIR